YERYGVMHRNSFLNSPGLLEAGCVLKNDRRILFAGQITGCEGYMESACSGIVAAVNAEALASGKEPVLFPAETMTGALQRYVSSSTAADFQPMGAAFGLLPPLPGKKIRDKAERFRALADRATQSLAAFLRSDIAEVGS
ncbi:MAG: FAD-dependent oxidoreductase, partial [Clostridia bacterium]|nr:FAD-dependent oxidoreductase [Clostridia bacterium]